MNARIEQILTLLTDEIEERLRRKGQFGPPAPIQPPVVRQVPPSPAPAETEGPQPVPEELPPALAGPSHAARMLGRLALGLLIAIVLINIPLNRHGMRLATAMPDTASLIIRDGLVVKEQDDPDIYVYENCKFRHIATMDVFEYRGYTWGDVHIVEDGFLDDFEIGAPIYDILKCSTSLHIYRLENGQKRWIRDIETFEAEGLVWEDVRFVTCSYLRSLPDGETIPPGSGPPPQP